MYRYKTHRVFYRRLVLKFLIKIISVVKKNVLVNSKTVDLVPVFTLITFHKLRLMVTGVYFDIFN